MYDVIIVGARVAGSATAMLLARRGLRVLVLDRAQFPSDTLSTHQIQVSGVARLAAWGLLGRLLETTPANRRIRFDPGEASFEARIPGLDGVDFTICPRRTLLDATLVDAARSAGAEVRENTLVAELVEADGQVVGVRGREKAGPEFLNTLASDRRRRLAFDIAKAVGAKEPPAPQPRWRATYWADVPTGPGRSADARPGRAVISSRPMTPAAHGRGLARGRIRHLPPRSVANLMATLDDVGLGNGSAGRPERRAAPRICPATSGGRTARAGRWWATPACFSIRSPVRVSPTRSAMPSCFPAPLCPGWTVADSTAHSSATTDPATAPTDPCTTSRT
jgi:hypothetical protein